MESPLTQRDSDPQRDLQGQRDAIAGGGGRDRGDVDMMDAERTDDDDPRDASGSDGDGMDQHRPWYMPSFSWNHVPARTVSPTARSSPSTTMSSSSEDCREEDITMEREGGSDSYDRMHEPLKRMQGGDQQGNKRRRVGEAASRAFFHAIPPFTEHQQAIVEYTAPSTFTPLFYVLGYTRFAVSWVAIMYIGHFVQCALTTFGDETKSLRVKPWIGPLLHHLMDSYIWNHSMITVMLLYPHWFGDTAYALACFFTMAQQCLLIVMSLQTHYTKRKHLLQESKQQAIEDRLIDIVYWYGAGCLAFIVAGIWDLPYVLYIGLVEFNLTPLYLVLAHKKRMDAAMKKNPANANNNKGAAEEKDKKEAKKDK